MAADSPVFAAQYRQSSFFKLFESKLSVGEDAKFVSEIKNLLPDNASMLGVSGGPEEAFASIANQIQRASGRTVSDTEVAYRIAGRFLAQDTDEVLQLNARALLGDLFNRQQFAALGADDGLGIYVNKLGFASSLENQKNTAIQELEEMLARNSSDPGLTSMIRQKLNQLKLPTIAIYSPEAAIDPSISAVTGGLKAGFTVEELLTSVRSYVASSRNYRCR